MLRLAQDLTIVFANIIAGKEAKFLLRRNVDRDVPIRLISLASVWIMLV
jgi:hypothetical protein